MEETPEKSKGFKVEDRRRFSAEGELKPEHRSEPETKREQTTPESEPRAEPQFQTRAKPEPPLELTFSGFIVSLSTQALIDLGEIQDPGSNKPERNLPGAQQVIDILGILKEKTRGNLDRNEEGLLDSILFDLRMKYVEVARNVSR